MQCTNNLKQIGLAMHNYHDTNDVFAMAASKNCNSDPPSGCSSGIGYADWRGWSSLATALPFVEQMADFIMPSTSPSRRKSTTRSPTR